MNGMVSPRTIPAERLAVLDRLILDRGGHKPTDIGDDPQVAS